MNTQICQDFISELHIDVSHFCVDLDISIMDRIHRIADALAAASEAVARLSPLKPTDFSNHAEWYDTDLRNDGPVLTKSDHYHSDYISGNKSSSTAYNIPRSSDYQSDSADLLKPYSSSINLSVKCYSFEFNLHFPVPLEAIKADCGQKITEIRSKLWGTGDLHNVDQSNSIQNISWWRRTLRKEYLNVFMKKIRLTLNNNCKNVTLKSHYESNDPLQGGSLPKSKLPSSIGTNHKNSGGNEQELELLVNSISIHLVSDDDNKRMQSIPIVYFASKISPFPEPIKICIRIAPSGRTDLVECINENPMSKDFDDSTTTTTSATNREQQPIHFEVGVDLAAQNEYNNNNTNNNNNNNLSSGQSYEQSVEWSLWNQANPRQNCFIPLVIRRNFVQDAPKPHSKQITYYPGNKAHMSSYRQSASMHTHLFVHIKVPIAEITIENKQTVEILCLRLMYDLLLWQSLLPNDRRLRATLKRPGYWSKPIDPGTSSQVDHRYWFLSDPAPLASIYAHPEAARAAAELEAISPLGYHNVYHPSGLHYHSVRSDDDDDDEDDSDVIDDEIYNSNHHHSTAANDVNNCYQNYNGDNGKHTKWKNTWSSDLRKNFNNKAGFSSNLYSRQHTSNFNNTANTENIGPSTGTSVQYQSSICFQLDINSAQLTTFLPESSPETCLRGEKVIVNATNTILFAEVAHNSNPNLNYFEMEVGEFDVSYSCNPNSNPDVHHNQSDGVNASDSSKNIWPVLCHLSWDSIGYPYGSSLHQVGVSSGNLSNEPTISLALEHRQIHHLSESGNSTYDDEFILSLRIQDVCFIYWPLFSLNNRWDIFSNIGNPTSTTSGSTNYTFYTTTNSNNNNTNSTSSNSAGGTSNSFHNLIGLPNWFLRFCSLWQTPSMKQIAQEYSSYYAPDCLFNQHLHFERLTMTFSMPYPEYFNLSTNKSTIVNYHHQMMMPILHFMIGCESASITVNTAMEMLLMNPSTHQSSNTNTTTNSNNNNGSRVDVQPGMLVMAFINNLATFIFPFKFTSASLSGNTNSPNLRPSPSSSSDANHSPHPLLSEFRNWLNTLDLNKAVCVASLDHLEFRCFSEPVILPSTIDTTMYSNKSTPTIMNRFDMRITNNLLKINTCADSLVVLHKLVELFTITDSNCLSTHHHHHHLSPNVVKPSTSGTIDSGVKQFYAPSSSVSSPIHLHCSRNILDNIGKSGSGSSLDLIQDAISDVESVPSSPYKTFIPKRSSAVDIPSNTSVYSPKKNDQLLRGVEYKSSSNDSSTPPQPCRTVHNNTSGNNNNIRRKSSNSTIDVQSPASSNLTNSPTRNTSPTTDKYKTLPSVNKSRLYPDLSDHLKSISDDTRNNSQSSSLTDDFVFIDPSTVPALNYYSTPKEKIRCLLQPNVKSSNTTSDQVSFPNFDIHENFYSPPSSTAQSSRSHLVNQWNRLFTDPVKIYPRPLIAITLYDVSFEWNIYGGNDLLPLSSVLPGNIPVNEPSIPVRPQAKSTLSIASPLRDSSEILITPSHSSESLNNHKCMSNTRSAVSTTAINNLNNSGGNISSSPSQMTKLCPKPGYRFRHGRPVIQKPASVSNIGVNSAESNSEHVSLKLPTSDAKKGIRSRQLLYSQGGSGRQLDNCISFNISKLYFRHAKFPPRMKKFINQHNQQQQQQQSNSPQNLFNLTVDPYQRLIIHISNVVILDRVMNSNVNQLLYSYNKTYSTSTNLLPHNLNTPMLRMVVVCWPVVSHQIEQDSIIRPQQQQQTEKKIASGEIEGEDDSSVDDADDDFRKEVANNSVQSSNSKVEYIYLPQPDNLEVEVKLSVQPLKINLDQYTLLFLYEYQENFKRYLTASSRESDNFQMGQSVSSLELKSSPTSVCTQYGQTINSTVINNINTVSGSPSQSHVNYSNDNITGTPQSNQISSARPVYSSIDLIESSQPVLFIRKVTFYPDLPIHLDYHGRRLDLSGGSFHGLLAMLLQLTNAEFTIPRRVYQRGYQSLDRLIEEVVEDISAILSSQLPHAIVTSLGPMHEVTQFLLGLWDLIYQPVCSLYGTAELPNTPLDPSHISTAVCKLGLFKKPQRIRDDTRRSGEYLSSEASHSISRGGIIHGLRRGTRSFSTSTLWATLQLTIQGIRAVQSVAETAYDLVTPGPALRSRRLHLRQPADIREGFGNAVNVMTRGFQMVAEDLCGATVLPSEVEIGYKGPVGMVGDVLRQIPPTMVTPIVAGCEVTANILGGLRNQLRPEAKVEDEQKWKNTYGL
ncbi:unnamed protein product [Trichobilharzia szidati]|nr:unnamed protein product [Trichobilharzia szidati]